MAKVSVFNMEGSQVGDIELNDAVFGVEVNEHIVHKAVVHHLACRRQGTQSAKTRAEVSGGGRKPWRQKGTGHARQGSIRAPQWTGGGVVFAPKPRDYSFKMNKKEIRLAVKSVLTQKVNDNKFIVLDELKLEEVKTKKFVEVLTALDAVKSLVVLPTIPDENVERVVLSSRNIQTVKTTCPLSLNAYDLLKYDKVVVEKELISKIEEVYA